jgi:hypothetical protein
VAVHVLYIVDLGTMLGSKHCIILSLVIRHLILLENHLILLVCAILLTLHLVLVIALKCIYVLGQILVQCFVSLPLAFYVEYVEGLWVIGSHRLVGDY